MPHDLLLIDSPSSPPATLAPGPTLESCLPPIPSLDWQLLANTPFLFLGTGAIGRPLAVSLAWLGMKQALLVDRKNYKPQSRISQCDPHDVGHPKARVVAHKLQALGVEAAAYPIDLEELPPGLLTPDTVVIAALDNRLADAQANRLAVMMQTRLVKVNVEPAFLTASIRCYDFRKSPVSICAECQMSDAHYLAQKHPLSCDGGGPEQSTGSPRPLTEFAAHAAALAIAQFVCSPDRYAKLWTGMQWQHSLLGGRGSLSALSPNPHCRCDHAAHWQNLTRWPHPPESTTLRDLFTAAHITDPSTTRLRFSARVATSARCHQCGHRTNLLRWVPRLNRPLGPCDCDGDLFAEPFSTAHDLPAARLLPVVDQPLSSWGVPALGIIAVEYQASQRSFVIGGK